MVIDVWECFRIEQECFLEGYRHILSLRPSRIRFRVQELALDWFGPWYRTAHREPWQKANLSDQKPHAASKTGRFNVASKGAELSNLKHEHKRQSCRQIVEPFNVQVVMRSLCSHCLVIADVRQVIFTIGRSSPGGERRISPIRGIKLCNAIFISLNWRSKVGPYLTGCIRWILSTMSFVLRNDKRDEGQNRLLTQW